MTNGVWAIDDDVTVLAPSLSSIAEMLRHTAHNGDIIELRSTMLKAATYIDRRNPSKSRPPNQFRDEIGC